MTDDVIKAGLERARLLLGVTKKARGVTSASVHPTAEQIGALAGEAHKWGSRDVVARLYVFAAARAAGDALDMLRATVGDAGNGAVNGVLMLWVTAERDDEESEDFVDALRSSFAGRER